MENGLYTVVEFDENDKWFVLAERIINGSKFSYLVRVNQTEDDFIDEYQVVKSYFDGNDEYDSISLFILPYIRRMISGIISRALACILRRTAKLYRSMASGCAGRSVLITHQIAADDVSRLEELEEEQPVRG